MTINSNQGKAKQVFLGGSIRHQLAWAFVSVALILVTAFAGLLFERQRDFLYSAAMQQDKSLATSLASSSSSWVLANDIAGLNEVLQGFAGLPDLKRAYILSLHGEVLGSTQTDVAGLFVTDAQNQKLLNSPPAIQVLLANANQIDVAAPIMTGSRHVGWARVEMTMNSVKANLHSIIVMGINFIALAVLIVVSVAILLARGLTRRLHHLMLVATEVASGNIKVRAHLSGRDEICVLAEGFNQMLDALSNSERQRERINALYAAWTQSVNIIVRESDEVKLLTEVCRIIASHLAMKLVWVGMAEPDGRVCCVAASHPDSKYLRNITVSLDPTLLEGQGPIGRAIRDGAPIIVNSYLDDPSLQPWQVLAITENINAVAAFPLMRSGRYIGAMTVYSDEQDFFTHDLIDLMQGLTNDLSYALDNLDREKLRLKAEHELQIAAVAFDSQEGMLVTDAENKILRVNRAFIELTGYRAEEVIGKSPGMLSSGLQDTEFYSAMWESIFRDKYWQGEVWNKRKSGAVYPEWLCITAITNQEGLITNYVGAFTDISQRKADEDSIKALAYYDPLTKLPNRTLLFDRLSLALNVSHRNKTHGALMFVDLDNFKILNDTLGHDLGDQLLIEVGRRLQGCVRDVDTVARLGGDEFVVMLEFLDEQEFDAAIQAFAIAEKVRSILAELYRLEINIDNNLESVIEHYSTASVGFVLFMGHETRSEELLKRADLAMYQAKHAGRNEICAFVPEMQQRLNLRAALETDLRNALQRNELSLHYQVQVDVSGRPVGAEALIRWNQAERGMITPAEFIPLAEDTGLILPIGEWVLKQGCETLVGWANHPQTSALKLALNISSRQLSQVNFVEQIRTILLETGANPTLLKLEITESVILENVEDTIAKMHAIRDLGVSFSMDDFGTGYSSLSYLQKLPLQQLKIDQSFIKNMKFNNHDSAIVRTILALGENLDLDVIAEGVETREQFEHLVNFGCQAFQGYLFGRPVPADIFKQSLMEKQSAKG
jgi:diguanylate cyclase (GGDEF)-like protein/PAS domain S-box-containing protein